MNQDQIIDLITFVKYFESNDSVLQAKQEFPKMWEVKRQEVVNVLARKRII